MGPECLRRLHDERAGRVGLPVHRKGARRPKYADADVSERVHKLRRRREVWLIRRNDVAACVALRGIAEHAVEKLDIGAVAEGRYRIADGTRAGRSGRSRRTAAAAASSSARRWFVVARLARQLRPTTRLGNGALDGGDVRRGRRPIVAAALLDRVLPHPVNVEQQLITLSRRVVEHRVVRRHGVIDRLPEVPHRLRIDRVHEIGARQRHRRNERNALGRRIPDRLGEETDHVVEVRNRAQTTVPPRRVARAGADRDPGLVLHREARLHCRANGVDSHRNRRIEVVVEGIAEGRREHHRAGGTGLVMVVDDLREPIPEHDVVVVLRLVLVRHVEVTIVVVTDVLLVKPRNVHVPLECVLLLHVPARDELHPVRVDVNGEDDVVVQDPPRLLIVAAQELIHALHQLRGP